LLEFYEGFAIPADSFARAVAFAIQQPDDVDINEILFRPIRQELRRRSRSGSRCECARANHLLKDDTASIEDNCFPLSAENDGL